MRQQPRPPTIEKLVPRPALDKYRKLILYSSIDIDPDQFLNLIVIAGLVLSLIGGTITNAYFEYNILVVILASLIVYGFGAYILLQLSAESKAKFVEDILPDALQLMASNIRAGLTTDKALLLAARPEFGPLKEEIQRIGRETMAGRSFVDALTKSTRRIKSKNMERTFALIVQSLKSGGQLADLLDQSADDMRDQQMIQKEISASVLMYAIFIAIAIVLGAPMLFALSSFLLELLVKNMELITAQMPMSFKSMASSSMPIAVGSISLDPDFAITYSMLSIAISSFFGSIVMGSIMKGEETAGLKYFPVMLIAAICLFYVIHSLLQTYLGGMFGF